VVIGFDSITMALLPREEPVNKKDINNKPKENNNFLVPIIIFSFL